MNQIYCISRIFNRLRILETEAAIGEWRPSKAITSIWSGKSIKNYKNLFKFSDIESRKASEFYEERESIERNKEKKLRFSWNF